MSRRPPPPPPKPSSSQYGQQAYHPAPQSPQSNQYIPPGHRQSASLSQAAPMQLQPLAGSSTVGRGVEGRGGGERGERLERGEARGETTQGVVTGAIGAGYGPYSYQSVPQPPNQRDSTYPNPRDSTYSTYSPTLTPYARRHSLAPSESGSVYTTSAEQKAGPSRVSEAVPMYLWDAKDPDLDDALHNPDPALDARLDRQWTIASLRGWINVGMLVILSTALITLFAGYPIIQFFSQSKPLITGFNLGGINASGQVPAIPGVWALIDPTTPSSAMSRTGYDGQAYELVFSDEFNTDGRTFYPGDDPYWEAVNLQYWATVDYEWYDPSAITTKDGKLMITMTEELIHNLNWKSGMLQSWNKFCFTTGYVEVSVSLPGSGAVPGFWPGVWMMGNLGRAGYGATTEGLWPYSYDSCDLGTFPNQTTKQHTPATSFTDGDPYNGYQLSYLPGQRLSACTCPNSDHPGPAVTVGRGSPEIDILEAQVNVWENQGSVSQSYQVAPFNDWYEFDNTTTTLFNPAPTTIYNGYKGGVYQQSVSAVTLIDNANYNGTNYGIFGVEYYSNPSDRGAGLVTWIADGQKTWEMPAAAIRADPVSQVSDRIVSEEPMSLIINFGMSSGFQGQDFTRLQFPATMYVDYVRVYQRTDVAGGSSVSCDPPGYPTAEYINNHLDAYMNPNWTTWDAAGFTFPRNSMYDGC